MNPKIQKLRTELEKNEEKIEKLQNRNQELRKQITALENTEIIGMIRESGWSIDEVAALLHGSTNAEPNTEPKEDN